MNNKAAYLRWKRLRFTALISLAANAALVILVIALLCIRSCAVQTPLDDTSTFSDTKVKIETQAPVISKVEAPEPTPPIEIEPPLVSLGEFTVTAYCPCVKCCGVWSAEHPSRIGTDYIQKTASGTIPTAGRTIAADPSVLPYGTVIVMDGNEYIVEDRGGAVKGNKIDIFFESHEEALKWGKQTKIIYIKGDK